MAEHEEGQHSVLSPSSAERWISCPASVRMARTIPQPPEAVGYTYSGEGTAAHALSELYARTQILKTVKKTLFNREVQAWRMKHAVNIKDENAMHVHAQEYVDLLIGMLEENQGSTLLLEQRVPTGLPSCWGTSDAVIVSPVHIGIVDLKYGMGVQVEAKGNPQLKLYGVGALEAFGDLLGEVQTVTYTVFQPRLNHTVSETISAEDLRGWRDGLLPIAESALGHDAPFGPSDEACRWCPASGQCKAQYEYAVAVDFSIEPEALSPDEISEILERIPLIEQWCNAVKEHALDMVYAQQKKVPGWKAVLSGGKRFVSDEQGAIDALHLIGYTNEQIVNSKIKGIGDLESLLGKAQFKNHMTQFISKSPGRPSLVTEDDPRADTSPMLEAAREFKEIEP